jgi:hypothetical protein
LGAARDDVRLRAREGGQMRLDHPDLKFTAPELSAARRFVEAVRALSDNPQPENVERYLVASCALEHSRSRRKPRESRAA